MMRIFSWPRRGTASLSDDRGGPWGPGDGDGNGAGGGPRNPWGPRRRRPPGDREPGENSAFDEFLRRSRDRFGGGFPSDGRPYWLYGLIAFLALWIVFTSTHSVGQQQRGVVTFFGRYSTTLRPGIGFSWPAPIGGFQLVNAEGIRTINIPPNGGQMILTGDQNVVSLAYTVRWNVKTPEYYLFRIRDPDTTIREVAESAMRAVVSRVSLDEALGAGRDDIQQRVQQAMQQLLDSYGSGVQIQGVAINQSAPPDAVNEDFLRVSAAQQQAQSLMNAARAYALQQTARAQGDAAAFEKVYAQYRLAPEVTRRRMYYETMERILAQVDTTIIEAPGVTPYLALPEIQRRQLPLPQTQPQGGQPR